MCTPAQTPGYTECIPARAAGWVLFVRHLHSVLPVSLVLANVLKIIIFKKDSHEEPPPPGSDAASSTYQTTVVKEEAVGDDPLSVCSDVDPLSTKSENVAQMVLNDVVNNLPLAPAEAGVAPAPALLTVNEQGGKLFFGRTKIAHSFN